MSAWVLLLVPLAGAGLVLEARGRRQLVAPLAVGGAAATLAAGIWIYRIRKADMTEKLKRLRG